MPLVGRERKGEESTKMTVVLPDDGQRARGSTTGSLRGTGGGGDNRGRKTEWLALSQRVHARAGAVLEGSLGSVGDDDDGGGG